MSLVRKQKKKVKNAALCCIFQTVDKALRESMFLGAFFYHYKDVWV